MKIIGIIPDIQLSNRSNNIKYTVRKNYCDIIIRNGGMPLIIPYCEDNEFIKEYINKIDGLMLIGGDDILPEYLGHEAKFEFEFVNKQRIEFEYRFLDIYSKKNKPVLGICYGMQILNLYFGGTIIEDIPYYQKQNKIVSFINHKQNTFPKLYEHEIIINKDTKFYNIFNSNKILVNSVHHQAVDKLADNLLLSAKAEDGITEAFISKNDKILGIQWHPEKLNDENSNKLLSYFINEMTE